MRSAILILCVLLPAVSGTLTARPSVPSPPDSISAPSVRPDSTTHDSLRFGDSLSVPYRQTKSTLLAMGLSAAVPGLGQVYNGSYWKVPVIAGFAGWFIYNWIDLNKSYKNYKDRYAASVTAASPGGDQNLMSIRDFYRNERDSFAWYLGILYAVNIIDAYVDASLYDFDQGTSVHFDCSPKPAYAGVSLRVRF